MSSRAGGPREEKLDPKSKAASILLRQSLNMGYAAGPDFPGDTIRRGIDRLYKLGMLADDAGGRIVITAAGLNYLQTNHLTIYI